MLKKSASIAVCTLALSFAVFASKEPASAALTEGKLHSIGRGESMRLKDVDRRGDHTRKTSVPEPGSLLAFGTAMLMGATVLRRKSIAR